MNARFQVKVTYHNFETGQSGTRILPKIYKTWRGAEAAAQQHRWVTTPDRHTVLSKSDAEVIEVPR